MRKIHNDWNNIPLDHNVERIYHYTSTEGLNGIFKNQQLWANDIYRQNDKSEGVYILKLLEDNIATFNISENFKDAILREVNRVRPVLIEGYYDSKKYRSFIISFSTEQDELALWNYYTKSKNSTGYNIVFDTNILMKSHIQTKKLDRQSGEEDVYYQKIDDIHFRHGKVIYEQEIQIDIIRQLVKDFERYFDRSDTECEYHLVDKLLWVGNFFKHPKFKHEYEYRMAFFCYTNKNNPKMNDVAVEVEGNKKNHIEIYFNPLSIMAVTCSPTNSDKEKEYLNQFMTPVFSNFTSVENSEIPFRVI